APSNASTSKSSPAANDRSIVSPWPAAIAIWYQSASTSGTSHADPVSTTGVPTPPMTLRAACGPSSGVALLSVASSPVHWLGPATQRPTSHTGPAGIRQSKLVAHSGTAKVSVYG